MGPSWKSTSPANGWATPRRSSSISRGSRRRKIEKVDGNHVKALVKIEPNAALGLVDLRVRTATGFSELRTFSVGALKETTEAEPNDEFAKPQKIAFGSVVNGVARNEDVDYYAFEVKKGERITAEVEGTRLGIALFDPYVAIMDSRRFELASSDDAALIWQDAFASVDRPRGRDLYRPGPRERLRRDRRLPLSPPHRQLPQADRHRARRWQIRRDARRQADRRCPRREDGPRHTPGRAEARVRHRRHRCDKGTAPQPNGFRLSPFGNVIEAEPNDDQNSATALRGVDGAERRDRQARGRRPLRLSREEGAELQHPGLSPASSGRRSTR